MDEISPEEESRLLGESSAPREPSAPAEPATEMEVDPEPASVESPLGQEVLPPPALPTPAPATPQVPASDLSAVVGMLSSLQDTIRSMQEREAQARALSDAQIRAAEARALEVDARASEAAEAVRATSAQGAQASSAHPPPPPPWRSVPQPPLKIPGARLRATSWTVYCTFLTLKFFVWRGWSSTPLGRSFQDVTTV